MVPDDHHRPVENHVVAIINRDKNLIEQRQKEKYQWYTVAASHLNDMSAQRKSHLSNARNALDQQSYAHFVREYDHSLQYYAKDEERDGVMGCIIRHVSDMNGEGRFIPDSESCNTLGLCKESRAMTMCRHDIVRSKHRNVPVFDPNMVDPVHLFHTFIPRARRDGSWVTSVKKRSGECNNSGGSSGASDDNFSEVDPFGGDEYVKEEDGMEGVIESSSSVAAATAPTQNNLSELLASPSKQLMPTLAKNAEGTSTVELRRSVPYNDFLKMGQEIGGLAVSSCTHTQHAIYSHLQAIKNLLTIGDYNHERHAGTSVEGLSMLLAVVAKDRTPAGEDQPKARVVPKRGRKPTHRLGSENSTVSAKKPRSCRFCKKQGCQTNSCNTKNEWGESISISNSTLSQIAQKLEQIAEGKHADFRDMSTVMELDRIGTKIVDAIPKGTKRLQVKGYLRYQENQYLFCTCINSEGEIHTRSEGSQLISYADVFIKKSAVVVSFSNMMDHIFWKPSVGGNEVV